MVAQFYSKIVQFLLHPVVGMFSSHFPTLVGRISLRCFGISFSVCIVLPFVDIFLIFLISPLLYGSFPQVILLFSLVSLFFFLSWHVPAFYLCFIILSVLVDFLFTFPVEFPIQVLIFYSCSLKEL